MKTKNNEVGKDEVTIISSGVEVEGKLNSNGNIRIDGIVNGNVNAKGNVTIGESGRIKGDIIAGVVIVGGSVDGSIEAKEKLTLESKSNLKGDLISNILVVEAGAMFDGTSKMGNKGSDFKPSLPQSSPQSNEKKPG